MKAIILCGGYGSRLKELTKQTPKPLLKIKDRSIIDYQLDLLKSAGVTEVGINLFYLGEQIEKHLMENFSDDFKFEFIYEKELSGTAGPVKKFASFLKGCENFFVLYGDIFTNQNLSEIVEVHQHNQALITFLTHQREKSNSYVELEENKVTMFLERPEKMPEGKSPYWVNSGIYLCSEKVICLIPENQKYDFPKDVFPQVLEQGQLYACPLSGQRVAIDSPERLELANQL